MNHLTPERRLLKTKTFVEERIYERPAGAAPDDWRLVKVTDPIDDTINEWVANNRVTIVSTSPPGINSRWLDKDMTSRAVLIALTIIYEGDNNAQWPERV
jgi:hypothetical protein